jgi:modulator of FtsH protease
MPTYRDVAYDRPAAVADTRAVFGQVMGLVAITVGFSALGAYIGRNATGGAGIIAFIGALICLVGLHFAARRSHQLAVGLLFAVGLLLGLGAGPVVAHYARTQPSVVWQAAGATGAFVAALGAYGYATRRDLSSWARTLFWMLLGLILFGLVGMFVAIPGGHLIYALLGLGIFGAYTIFDFNRLRRAGTEDAVFIAAGIFLDIFNIFLFMLQLLGGSRD